MPPAWFLVAFMLWGAIRTVPFLGTHGLDALRDGALWGYAIFAFIVAAAVIGRGHRIYVLLRRYRQFVGVAIPVVYLTGQYGRNWPVVPGSEVAIFSVKAGDVLVHLAGVSVFVASGLRGLSVMESVLLSVSFVLAAVANRGGLVAFLLAVGVVAVARPWGRRFRRVVLSVGLVVALLGVAAVSTDVGRRRGIGAADRGQLAEHCGSWRG